MSSHHPRRSLAARTRFGSSRARWLATGAALILGLLAAEGGVRLLDPGPALAPVRIGGLLRKSENPLLHHENLPGASLRVEYPADSGAVVPGVLMRVNAQGLRGPLVAREKPRGVYRIACLGDSHTFGLGVGEGQPWPAVLRTSPLAVSGGRPIEVLNFGVNGYDTLQELELLRERVLDFSPDLVLVQYHVNDIFAHALGRGFELERGFLYRTSNPARGGLIGGLRGVSCLADLLLRRVFESQKAGDYPRALARLYADESPQWLAVQEALEGLRDELASRSIGFAVVLFPLLVEQGGHYVGYGELRRVAAFCASRGIACLDGGPALLAARGEPLQVSTRDWHANARAHRAFGEAVSAWLEIGPY